MREGKILDPKTCECIELPANISPTTGKRTGMAESPNLVPIGKGVVTKLPPPPPPPQLERLNLIPRALH